MKKIIPISFSLLVVMFILFFSCKKVESGGIAPGYASQSGTTGSTSTTSGTDQKKTDSSFIKVDSAKAENVAVVNCSTIGSSYQTMAITESNKACVVAFMSVPKAGSYNVVTSTPKATQVNVTYTQNAINYYGQSGLVTVTFVNGKIKTSFSNISCDAGGSRLRVSSAMFCQ